MSAVPQGIPEATKFLLEGGDVANWAPLKPLKYYTNAFITDEHTTKVLLGLKKRGIGMGLYNGFGGKVEPGETSLQAATRELEEEAGIRASLEHAGVLLFVCEGLEFTFHIDIYRASSYTGDIIETDEMVPQWFAVPDEFRPRGIVAEDGVVVSNETLPALPMDKMWATDPYWLPLMLSRKPFIGRSDFRDLTPLKWWFGAPLEGEYEKDE